MRPISPEKMAEYGIISAGGSIPRVVHDEPQTSTLLAPGKMFVDKWVNERVDPQLRRGPIVHVFCVAENGEILADTTGGWLDYGYFSVLGTEEGFQACWTAYQAAHETGFSEAEFRRLFKARPLANATLVITADGKMLCVRRAAKMHLHPGCLHCSGGKVAPVKVGETIDLEADALERIKIETGIPRETLEQPTCLGVCGNSPYDEVIALFTVLTKLTAAQVVEVYKRAQDPDGGVEWYAFDLPSIRKLLRRQKITPSFRALLFLLRRQITAENRKKK